MKISVITIILYIKHSHHSQNITWKIMKTRNYLKRIEAL